MRRLSEWIHALPFRVATKFAGTFTLGALVAIAFVVTALALHERRAVIRAAVVDLRSQGDAIAPMLGEVWASEGEARALEMLRVSDAANADVALTIEEPSSLEGRGAPSPRSDRVTVVVPIESGAFAPGRALVLEKAVPPLSSALAEALKAFLLAAIPLGAFALFSSYALGEWLVGAPLRRVAERTRRIGEGDLEHPLVVRGSAEIAELKRAINQMSEDLRAVRIEARDAEERRVDAVNRLRHADRLTTVGTLAAGIAHELGTPLNTILLESRAIERAASDATRVQQGLELIRNQAGRMIVIVRQLLDFARRKQPERTLEDALQVVSSSAILVSSLARVRGCTIVVAGAEESLPVRIDVAGVQQILTNLFVNAFDAMPDGGQVRVRVTRATCRGPRDDRDRSWIRIEIQDEGVGMDEASLTRAFEPFFTTKDVGSGTGLGLSVALGIAEDHGGFIDARTSSPRGMVFAVHLPIDDPREHDEHDPTPPPDGARIPREPARLTAFA